MGIKEETIYNIFLVVGFAVPVLDSILGIFSSIFSLDFDFDGDTNLDSVIPFNMMSLMFAFIVFGSLGKMNLPGGFIIPLICAMCGYVALLKWVVMPLKRNKSYAKNIKDFIGYQGEVVTTVQENGIGEIEISTETEAKITYFAKSVDGTRMNRGEKVKVLEVIDDNTVLVTGI